jgi:K+-sensing histidine kinase KdpD
MRIGSIKILDKKAVNLVVATMDLVCDWMKFPKEERAGIVMAAGDLAQDLCENRCEGELIVEIMQKRKYPGLKFTALISGMKISEHQLQSMRTATDEVHVAAKPGKPTIVSAVKWNKSRAMFLKNDVQNLSRNFKAIASIRKDLSHEKNSIVRESRVRLEQTLAKRQRMLKAIYDILTSARPEHSILFDKTLQDTARILKVPYIALLETDRGAIKVRNQVLKGRASRKPLLDTEIQNFKTIHGANPSFQTAGELTRYFICPASGAEFKSLMEVPVKDHKDRILGAIIMLSKQDGMFDEYDIYLVEIIGRFIASEMIRERIEANLVRAREMEIVGALTSGVAHEVRNPLNSIMAVSEALFQELGDDGRYNSYRERIQRQIQRLSLLMQDLLFLGRPMDKESISKISPLKAATNSVDAWKESTTFINHKVRFDSREYIEKRFIKVDYSKFQQMFFNILENACASSPVKEEILVSVRSKGKTVVNIEISDRGRGVKPENLERLFEPFFSKRKGGTGLGMSIIKNTVEMHGGTIQAYNNDPPPGFTVKVTLPLV